METTAKKDRIGETRMMNCGMKATIVEYYNAHNIDVQFEDNRVRRHVAWKTFVRGTIAHPDKAPVLNGQSRVGEIKQMNNGLNAKIIKYRGCNDIDVKFEVDGAIVKSKSYKDFKNGTIAHPNIKFKNSTSLQEFAIKYYLRNYGFVKIKSGQWKENGFGRFELDFYNIEKNVAIEIDGGIHILEGNYERDVRKNKKCKSLKITLYRFRDSILPILNDGNSTNYIMNRQKQIRIGLIDCKEELESILQKHGIPFGKDDIDFIRDEDLIVNEYNSTYMNYYKQKYIGQKVYCESANQYMTLIDYHDSNHVSVQFDDGTIVYDKQYVMFKAGSIRNPNVPLQHLVSIAEHRLGETKKMKNGQQATIIAYRSCTDIDVKFEDGTIIQNREYGDFKKGNIANPNFQPDRTHAALHLNETRVMKNGMTATIIKYRGCNDIDIRFEDGTIREHAKYGHFLSGRISPIYVEDRYKTDKQNRTGETKMMNCGQKCTIVEYYNSHNMTVQFENGTILHKKYYSDFVHGRIKNPITTKTFDVAC